MSFHEGPSVARLFDAIACCFMARFVGLFSFTSYWVTSTVVPTELGAIESCIQILTMTMDFDKLRVSHNARGSVRRSNVVVAPSPRPVPSRSPRRISRQNVKVINQPSLYQVMVCMLSL